MSILKKISLAVLVVLLLLLGTVAFFIGTTTGLHLLFNAANKWVPGLHIEDVDGGWRGLTLKNIRYQQPGIDVDAKLLHLALDTGCLWKSHVCVNALSVEDVNVLVDSKQIPPSSVKETEDNSPLNLSTLYPITLNSVNFKNINVKVDDTTISLLDFASGLNWENRNITLKPTTLEGLFIGLPKVAKVVDKQVVDPKIEHPSPEETPLGDALEQLFAKPLLPEIVNVHLPVNLDIENFQAENLRLKGDTDITIYSLLLKAKSDEGHFSIDTFDVNSSEGKIKLAGQARLADNWPLTLSIDSTLNVDPLKGEKVNISIDGALRAVLNINASLSGDINAKLNAQTRLAEAGLPLNIDLESKQLYWPLNGEKAYQADNLKLSFSGQMTDYKLTFNSSIKGKDLPPSTLSLNGKGNIRQFILDKLQLSALQGNTTLTGLVDWSKAISWNMELALANINTAKQYPDWPAKLNGDIKTSGSLYAGKWQIDIPELKLVGNVKQNKVNLSGKLKGNSDMQWSIPGVNIELGRNHVDIKGELGEKALNLDADINAPRLNNILPGLAGSIKGLIKVRGNTVSPQLLADLNGNGLRFQDFSIGKLQLKGDVTSNKQISGQLGLRIEKLAQSNINLSLITLDVKGNEKQHDAKLRVQGEPVSGRLSLTGSFDRTKEQWLGKLTDTRFDTPVGPWVLNRPMTLDFQNEKQRVAIGQHCWINPNAEICVPKTIDVGKKGQASVNLNRFDLAMLKPFMPKTTQASGIFTAKANVTWDAESKGLPQGEVTIDGNSIKVAQIINGQTLPVAFTVLKLNAGLKNNIAHLGWMIRIADNGQIDGLVKISDPVGRRNLSGNINIDRFSLAIVNKIFTRGEKAQGILNANLRLGGNLQRPKMFGQIKLNDVDIKGNFMPFEMQPSQIVMQFNGMDSTLQGALRTKRGQIVLDGDADWAQFNNWRARVTAKGDKVRITVPPMVRLDVSPDIEFIATPNVLTLNGRVDIPWARVAVKDLPESAVGVSSDLVMLDENLQPIAPPSTSIPINSNLLIHIGNDVRLEAFGLKARLTGDLKLVQDKQRLGLNGQINIPQGRFRAYGQDLIVRKGELLFSGPPEQPYINLEAIRNPDATENDVIAGIRVTGVAPEPKAEIFSDPTMSQQEALSYLLRGQGLSSSGGDGDAMTSMLVGLGVAQSGQIVGKIGEAFGVSNLSLDTAGVGDSSQVVVSGYVLPGLQVMYGVGIFDSLATLTLRYRLMPKLYLEAVSGIDQALDLLYQFEF